MATNTYIALATTTLAGLETSVTFSSIPSSYRDLVLVSDFTTSGSSSRVEVQANGVTSGYPTVIAFNTGSQTFTAVGLYHGYTESAERCTSIMHILDYSATGVHKTSLNRHGTLSSSYVIMGASRFASTSAITSLKIVPLNAVSFAGGSTFSLYGIAS